MHCHERLLHGGPKKQDTQLLWISSTYIDRFSKFFYWYTQQEICNKDVITDPATPQWRRYTTLQNISLQKSRRLKAQQRQTKRAHSEEITTAVGELVLSH